jgi:hypothetical protein
MLQELTPDQILLMIARSLWYISSPILAFGHQYALLHFIQVGRRICRF